MEHDCDAENLTMTARQVYKIARAKATSQQQKEAQKGQSMEHGYDVDKLKIQSSCEAILCAEESRSRSNLMIKAC